MMNGKLPPADRARHGETKAIGRRAAVQAAIDRRDDPVPQVLWS